MKRIFKNLLCTITILSLFIICASASESKALTWEDFDYSVLSDGTIKIDKCNRGFEVEEYPSTESEDIFYIIVPSEIEGKNVTVIGEKAFAGVGYVKGVKLPDTIRIIEEYAFTDTDFSEIQLCEGLETIGDYAFYNAYISSIAIPSTVKKLGKYSIGYCTDKDGKPIIKKDIIYCYENSIGEEYAAKNKLSFRYVNGDYRYIILDDGTVQTTGYTGNAKKLVIPERIADKKVTVIGYYTFSTNDTIQELVIPGTVETIKKLGCAHMKELQKVTMEYGFKKLGKGAFYGCKKLQTVVMPDSITKVGDSAFEDCTSLQNINFRKNITTFGSRVLSDTKYYKTEGNWENSILYAGTYAVAADAGKIKGSAEIKDGTTFIADFAFSDCKNITVVMFPDTLKKVGNNAFEGCTALKKVYLPEDIRITIAMRAFKNCKSLTKVYGSENIVEIGDAAFSYCKSLKEITLGKNLKTVGEKAFLGCIKLVRVNLESTKAAPTFGRKAFSATADGIKFVADKAIAKKVKTNLKNTATKNAKVYSVAYSKI
ncbi:MAG: leucine-rich repeat protein [Clostridia bacterium]|nr:leucine-rich repeat protein [Clostridia bacterium]